MHRSIRATKRGGVVAVLGLLAVGAMVGTTGSFASTRAHAHRTANVLGTPDVAKGKPIVFGMVSLEAGAVTFPEARAGTEAAIKYLNAYRGGIGGRPIKLVSCATDGQPATSAKCAGQLLDKKPVAIMGSADPGSPATIPVYTRANLAYLGGITLTPVEGAYKNAAIFSSISTGDNGAMSAYAASVLKAKSAAVIYTDDPPGNSSASVIQGVMKNAGISSIKAIPIPPTAADTTSYAAAAISVNPDVIYVDSPNACPSLLKSLKQLGNKAKILGIDPCTDPRAIAASAGGAEGMYFAAPVLALNSGTPDANLFNAVMKKYAPANTPLDSITVIGFQTAMNVQAGLDKVKVLNTANILAAFRKGTARPNFMGHPYTCNGQQLAGQPSVCNAHQQIRQVKNGVPVTVSGWITVGKNYKPS